MNKVARWQEPQCGGWEVYLQYYTAHAHSDCVMGDRKEHADWIDLRDVPAGTKCDYCEEPLHEEEVNG